MLVLLVIAAVCGGLMHIHYVDCFHRLHFASHRCLWQPFVHFMLVAALITCGNFLCFTLWWQPLQHRLGGWYCIIN